MRDGLLALLVSVATAGLAAGQECKVDLQPLVTLGSVDGPGIIESEHVVVDRDTEGRFFVATLYGTEIRVFDANGRYLRTIGRKGRGPGEYMGISVIDAGTDTIRIYDSTLQRLTLVNEEGGALSTTRIELPFGTRITRLDGRGFVIAQGIRTPERAGLPVHLVDPAGRAVRSFGAEEPLLRTDIPWFDSRAIALGPSPGTIWVAHRNQYRIELWDTNGSFLDTIEPQVEWFPPQFVRVNRAEEPPPVFLQALWQDGGHLWTVAFVPDEDWGEAVGPGGAHVSIEDDHAYQDTRIQVLDLDSRRILGDARFDQKFRLADPNFVGSVLVNQVGVPRLNLWTTHLMCDSQNEEEEGSSMD